LEGVVGESFLLCDEVVAELVLGVLDALLVGGVYFRGFFFGVDDLYLY
jgi:hypothetical protein